MSRDILEDLRVADREALLAEGTLENVFADALLWMSSIGRRPRRGEIRPDEIDQAMEVLDLAMARADGALARLDRSSQRREFSPPASLGYRWPLAARTADRAHTSRQRVRQNREWLRARFDELATELEPKPEPLSALEPWVDETSQRERALAKATGKVYVHVLFIVLFAAVVMFFAVFAPR